MKNLTTIANRKFLVSANKSARTFTIREGKTKYRTLPMSISEFSEALHYTGNDWVNFLKTDSYSIVK